MNLLRALVTRWSVPTEVLVTLLGVFGIPLLNTASALFRAHANVVLNEQHLRLLLIAEPLLLLIFGGFLHLRGWTPKRLGLVWARFDPLIAVAVAVGAYVVFVVLWMTASAAGISFAYLNGTTRLVQGHLSLLSVIGVCLVNPVFEELFVCGYLIAVSQENRRLALGVNASVGLRLSYHLYQGGIGVIGIVPFGLICALWFSRTGRLWPVIIAHGLMDLVGLIQYAG